MAKSSKKSNRKLWVLLPVLAGVIGLTVWLRNQLDSGVANPTDAVAENIYYLGPDEYYMNRAAYVLDEDGQTRMDTVLLPLLPDSVPAKRPATTGGYLGPQSCAECHRENFDGFMATSHASTSALPSEETILGSFEAGENRLDTASPNLSFEMVKHDDTYFQRLMLQVHGETQGGEFPFDIVTGSGKVGQTYLYFQGEHLYQLHASYLSSTDSWMNSPDFLDGVANFARPVLAFCLECHTTYSQPYEDAANQYHREHFVLGVTCEKCHGPGEEHVTYHQQHPDEKTPHAIVNPGTISPERSLELCQLCHGGTPTQMKQIPFSYRPGEPLDEYYEYPPSDGSQLSTGIHTNSQLPRLKRSRCFQESEAMTCIDCHNPHQFERGDTALFSARCINCHQPADCGQHAVLGDDISQNCIDCHMISVDMSNINLMSEGKTVIPKMRDHFITIWPEATEAFLKNRDLSPEAEDQN